VQKHLFISAFKILQGLRLFPRFRSLNFVSLMTAFSDGCILLGIWSPAEVTPLLFPKSLSKPNFPLFVFPLTGTGLSPLLCPRCILQLGRMALSFCGCVFWFSCYPFLSDLVFSVPFRWPSPSETVGTFPLSLSPSHGIFPRSSPPLPPPWVFLVETPLSVFLEFMKIGGLPSSSSPSGHPPLSSAVLDAFHCSFLFIFVHRSFRSAL